MDSRASLKVSLGHDVEVRYVLSFVIKQDERERQGRGFGQLVNHGREGGGRQEWRLNDSI
jgi:hypothetical protein